MVSKASPDSQPPPRKHPAEVRWLLRDASQLMDTCLHDGVPLPLGSSIHGIDTHRTLTLRQTMHLLEKSGVFEVSINGDILIKHAGEYECLLSDIIPTIHENKVHMVLYRQMLEIFHRFESAILKIRPPKDETFGRTQEYRGMDVVSS